MVWVINSSPDPIPCPRGGCGTIAPGDEHIDIGGRHEVRRYQPPRGSQG